jgi:nucleoside-diphosphate-sugar epimerase
MGRCTYVRTLQPRMNPPKLATRSSQWPDGGCDLLVEIWCSLGRCRPDLRKPAEEIGDGHTAGTAMIGFERFMWSKSAAQGNSGMRTLVTGGAGFIGSHLCQRLFDDGDEVICLDNLVTGSLANVAHLCDQQGFGFVEHDVIEPLPPMPRFDRIFHLASPASPVAYQRYPIQTLLANGIGTHRMLNRAARDKAGFLFASTSEVYGDPLEHPQREDYWGNVNPVGPRAMYDEAKRYGEALTATYRETHGVEVRIARIFNTYGPRMELDDGRVVSNLMVQALRGEPLTVYGDGSQTRSFQYVDDLVAGLVALMESGYAGPVNVGNPAEYTILQVAQLVQRQTGTGSQLEFRPLPIDDPKQRRPDIALARSLLNWEPRVSLESGLARTGAYLQKALGLVPCGQVGRRADQPQI